MPVKQEISSAENRILNGVFVISTKSGDRVNAMTAAWVQRASFEPPIITVAVGKTRFTHDMILESGVFAVNVLGEDGKPTGKHFGLKTGRKTDKFEGIEYDTKATGSPILKDCIAWMDCRVRSHHDAGDHTLIIGEVVDGDVPRPEARPLIYDKEGFYR